jgi:hypothetical protein
MSLDPLTEHYRCPPRYNVCAPFDANELIDNLRFERYMNARQGKSLFRQIVRDFYYIFRPVMGVAFRKHLQRVYLRNWQEIPFPHWPVDRTVECIFEYLVMLALELRAESEMPFVWFWPDGYNGCLILTHDIETEQGRDFAEELADIDASFGMKSSFQIVPEKRYDVPCAFLDALRSRGCEVNLHGLNHDGDLFDNRNLFVERVEKINRYAKEYGADGFRSPVLYRNLDWYADLEFSYDMSVPNCGHMDPQRGGCCTVMPYFIGDILELPLTMVQDYSLFHILQQNSIQLWKHQIDLVLEKNGLVSFNIHPDYMIAEPCRKIYYELLEYLAGLCAERNVWMALPGDVNRWWRQRREIGFTGDRNADQGGSRAVAANARVQEGRLVYELAGSVLYA